MMTRPISFVRGLCRTNKRHQVRTQAAREIAESILGETACQDRLQCSNLQFSQSGLADFMVGTIAQRCQPIEVFDHLRWGGQFIFVSPRSRETSHLAKGYRDSEEFQLESGPQRVRRQLLTRLDHPRGRHYYFVARKLSLLRPGDPTDRYSYDVCLASRPGAPEGYAVLKQVPSYDGIVRRLKNRFPHAKAAQIERGAAKLRKAFPVFLTREAQFLRRLQQTLPDRYRCRVPRVLATASDRRGLVHRLYISWLRVGGQPISQLDFAIQGADLLRIIHEKIGLVHMDLRLDNIVVTEKGVGFIDFGSAAQMGESFGSAPLIGSLYSEMISMSQIQRDLALLRDHGKLTSSHILSAYRKIDRAVDLFYFVLQWNNPHRNGEFRGIIDFDPRSEMARRLSRMTDVVFHPANPEQPTVTSAADLLTRLLHIKKAIDSPNLDAADEGLTSQPAQDWCRLFAPA